jgi:hypothetical protein
MSAVAAQIAFVAAREAEEMADLPSQTIARILRQRELAEQMASTDETSISLAANKIGRKSSRVGNDSAWRQTSAMGRRDSKQNLMK